MENQNVNVTGRERGSFSEEEVVRLLGGNVIWEYTRPGLMFLAFAGLCFGMIYVLNSYRSVGFYFGLFCFLGAGALICGVGILLLHLGSLMTAEPGYNRFKAGILSGELFPDYLFKRPDSHPHFLLIDRERDLLCLDSQDYYLSSLRSVSFYGSDLELKFKDGHNPIVKVSLGRERAEQEQARLYNFLKQTVWA